jgi:16S rRNA (guanine527-N7)-methyltransferase
MPPHVDPLLRPRLLAYLGLLDHWNRVHALTALSPDQRWEELVVDSAALLPHLSGIPAQSQIGDFGSGLGMPAVLLALARPDLQVLALDKSRKKCAFVRQVSLELGLPNLEVQAGRFEDLPSLGLSAGVAKALGSLKMITEWWDRHGVPGAPFYALKGQREPLTSAPTGWQIESTAYRLPTKGDRAVLTIRKGA